MADIVRSNRGPDLFPIKPLENKITKLKILQSRKQEYKSLIIAKKQEIEMLKNSRLPLLERDILQFEDSLRQVEAHEKMLQQATDIK